jgi:hypothetical protein
MSFVILTSPPRMSSVPSFREQQAIRDAQRARDNAREAQRRASYAESQAREAEAKTHRPSTGHTVYRIVSTPSSSGGHSGFHATSSHSSSSGHHTARPSHSGSSGHGYHTARSSHSGHHTARPNSSGRSIQANRGVAEAQSSALITSHIPASWGQMHTAYPEHVRWAPSGSSGTVRVP